MSSPVLFDRRCNLLVASASGKALDVGELHCKFTINRSDVQSPNWADVTVYNLADATAATLRREGVRLIIQAGYKDLFGVIFDGQIKQVRLGRENGTDSFVSIAAADGDAAYNNAVVNKTLEAGATLEDQVKAAVAAMNEHGTDEGFIDTLKGPSLPRGKVMFGMSKDYLRTVSRSSGATWSIQNGKVEVIKRANILPGAAVVLSPATGLIGTPTQTDRGVEAQNLINPQLRVGGRFKLDQSLILEEQLTAPTKSETSGSSSRKKKGPQPIAADGFYRTIIAEFSGDTRGNDWYVNVVGLPINGSASDGGVDPR